MLAWEWFWKWNQLSIKLPGYWQQWTSLEHVLQEMVSLWGYSIGGLLQPIFWDKNSEEHHDYCFWATPSSYLPTIWNPQEIVPDKAKTLRWSSFVHIMRGSGLKKRKDSASLSTCARWRGETQPLNEQSSQNWDCECHDWRIALTNGCWVITPHLIPSPERHQ